MVVEKPPVNPDYATEVDIGDEVRIPTNNVRAGVTHQNLRTMLVYGTLGVIVAFGIIYLLFFS